MIHQLHFNNPGEKYKDTSDWIFVREDKDVPNMVLQKTKNCNELYDGVARKCALLAGNEIIIWQSASSWKEHSKKKPFGIHISYKINCQQVLVSDPPILQFRLNMFTVELADSLQT